MDFKITSFDVGMLFGKLCYTSVSRDRSEMINIIRMSSGKRRMHSVSGRFSEGTVFFRLLSIFPIFTDYSRSSTKSIRPLLPEIDTHLEPL